MMARSIRHRFLETRLHWPLLALGLLLLFNFLFTPNFFRLRVLDGHLYGSLIDVLNRGAPIMLLASGMTLVIATGGIDLSVGSVVAIAGTLAAVLVTNTEMPFVAVLAITLGVSAVAGLWNGLLVAIVGIQPIVATLILMVAGRGIAKLLSDGQMVPFTESAPYVFLTNGHFLMLPFSVTIVVIALLATLALTRLTALGLFIESVGANETASRFSGIHVSGVKLLAYGVCGLCAGLAGLITASASGQADPSRMGMWMELDAIFAVVVGGTALSGGRFSLVGSVIGAILIQTLTVTMYGIGVSPAVAPVPKALVIVAVCLLQSEAFRLQCSRLFRMSSR